MKPILEVLVGKTIEQSLLEVMEEEELANLRSQQRAFEELRNAELVEQQRLEEQETRHREEKVSSSEMYNTVVVIVNNFLIQVVLQFSSLNCWNL